MKRINITLISPNKVLSSYKSNELYQSWIDACVAQGVWGASGNYSIEVLDADAELEEKRLQNEAAKKQDFDSHANSTSNPHAVTKAQIGLDNVDNVSADNLRDRFTHTGSQLASTISDFTTAVQATGNYITALTGDVTASGPGSVSATLADSGVVAGTYSVVTVDGKGRVTVGSNSGSIARYSYFNASAVATTSITYTNAAGLVTVSLPVGLYFFMFAGNMQSASTTVGVGVRIAPVTATITTVSGKFNFAQGTNGVSHDFEYDQIATATNLTSASVAGANTNFCVNGSGVFRVTVAGTVAIQTRTETAGTAVTLQPDSAFVLELV